MLAVPSALKVQAMSTTGVTQGTVAGRYSRHIPNWGVGGLATGRRARAYFASDARRTILSALGLIWLLDGALQLQPFMYSGGFVESLRDNATGQPLWLESSIAWGMHIVQRDLTAWNTLFALTQIVIGAGLLYRPTVKPALALLRVGVHRLVVRRGIRDVVHDDGRPAHGRTRSGPSCSRAWCTR
jgi:hypothetical protein